MKNLCFLFLSICSSLAFADPVTPMVTGNGFGFAVVPLQANVVSKFYVHPYKFTAPNHDDPYGDGFQTANLVKSLGWPSDPALRASFYLDETHIVIGQTPATKYIYFMPFALERPAVMLYRQNAPDACLVASWEHPVASTSAIYAEGLVGLRVNFTDIADA
ncbi:MAG: hypothetical protein ACXVA9_11710, partial [Bdellovibrionales bacterium]